jgi:hypothetical protein
MGTVNVWTGQDDPDKPSYGCTVTSSSTLARLQLQESFNMPTTGETTIINHELDWTIMDMRPIHQIVLSR